MLRARMCLGGMVTAPHHLAAEAGASVLREGGNAIEAMIASAAAIAVVYPHMNAIGGDGFWLVSHEGRRPIGIRACGPAAGLADKNFYESHGEQAIPTRGARAALTVAGAIGGWAEASRLAAEAGGVMPLSRLLEAAVTHGREGVPVSRSQERLTREKYDELADVPGFVKTFAANGLPSEASILRQPALSATLARLAENGLDDFYRGDLARTLASGLESAGSPLRLSDLENYRAKRVEPAEAKLVAGRVFNMPPPTQGVSSLMILRVFEKLGVEGTESFEHVHGL
ncbi:MAG: gamma-glutamyltransferase, partial [Pseudomonadota bacterium]